MGKKERIRLFDLFTAYFSFLLLVPVLILIFFWNRQHFSPITADKDDAKKVLANQISESLNNEIDSACRLLNKMDSLHAEDSILERINVKNLNHKVADANTYDLFKKENNNR